MDLKNALQTILHTLDTIGVTGLENCARMAGVGEYIRSLLMHMDAEPETPAEQEAAE